MASRRPVAVLVAFALVLGSASLAFASATEETVRLTAVDQAAARASTLRQSDFMPAAYGSIWRRVPAKPALPRPTDCRHGPDLSRVVITGLARTRWLGGAIEIDS